MRRFHIAALVGAGLALGSLTAVHAKLPPPPAKTDAEKSADAAKASAAKAKAAEAEARAEDKAVANYKKNKGMADTKASPATTSGKKK
jgi:hypothetical protein